MVSGIVTAVLLLVFVMGWTWAWSPRRRQAFEEAARLPLDDGLRVVTKNEENGR
jgi:cytochrome c oxidase cbb3-type subunit IV